MKNNSIDIYLDYDGDEFHGTIPVMADVDSYYVEFDLILSIINKTRHGDYFSPPETTRIKEEYEIEELKIYPEDGEITDEDYDKLIEEIKNRLWIC